MSPQAVRVRTSSGWQDIALQGAQGPAGSTPSAKAFGLFSYSGADNAHRIYTPTMTGKPWDEIGGFPAMGQPLIFTCPKAGRYSVLTKIAQVSAAGQINVSPIVNDATPGNGTTAQVNVKADSSETGGCENHCVLDLAVGNTIKLYSCHSGGGSAYLIYEIIQLAGLPGPIAGAPPYVTPAQFASLIPVDGQEVYLQVDAANGVVWHLRYNASSSSAYKWEYLGGPPLRGFYATNENLPTTWASGQPSITVPRAGEYDVDWSLDVNSPGQSQNYIAFYLDAVRVDSVVTALFFTANPQEATGAERNRVAIAAGQVVSMGFIRSGAAVASAKNRSLMIKPVRIS